MVTVKVRCTGYEYFSALNSKSLCAVVHLSAHELLRCREAEDRQLFILKSVSKITIMQNDIWVIFKI